MRRTFHIAVDAYWHFLADDGWAIASHIALSALMAMFPFFIVLTSLAGVFGSNDLADEVAKLMLATWPDEVSAPIAHEIHDVLTTTHAGALTVGALFAIFSPRAVSSACGSASTGRTAWWRHDNGSCCGWNRSATCWSPLWGCWRSAF